MSAKFTTRHTASSQLCHVDPEVTPYFGYLPQDIIGRSILEFYHPEDLHFLKEVYEAGIFFTLIIFFFNEKLLYFVGTLKNKVTWKSH